MARSWTAFAVVLASVLLLSTQLAAGAPKPSPKLSAPARPPHQPRNPGPPELPSVKSPKPPSPKPPPKSPKPPPRPPPRPPRPPPKPPSPPPPPPPPPSPPSPPKPPRHPPSPPKPPAPLKVKVGLSFYFNGTLPANSNALLNAAAEVFEQYLDIKPARVKLVKARQLDDPPPRFTLVYTLLGFFNVKNAQAFADSVFEGPDNLASWASSFTDVALLQGHPLVRIDATAAPYDVKAGRRLLH